VPFSGASCPPLPLHSDENVVAAQLIAAGTAPPARLCPCIPTNSERG